MAFDFGTFLSGLGGSLAGRAGTETPPAGGLAAAAPVAPAEEEIKIPETTDEARLQYFKEVANLRRQQQALLASLESRAASGPQETLRNISAAMLDPGRTGSFGEAFGRMQTGLSRQAAEDEARAAQIAKMRLELGQQNVGMAEKGFALAQEQQRIKALSDALGGNASALTAGAPGVSPGMIKTVFDELDDPTKALIRSMPPEKAGQFLLELIKQRVKPPEAVLTAEHWLNTLPENIRGVARDFYANSQLFGSAEARVRAQLEINNAVDQGKLSKEDAEKFSSMLMPSASVVPTTPTQAAPATPAVPGKPVAAPAPTSAIVAPSAPVPAAPPRPAAFSATSAEGAPAGAMPASYVRPAAPPAAPAPAAAPVAAPARPVTSSPANAGLAPAQIREQAAKRQEEARAEARKIEEENRAEERRARERIAESNFKEREALQARASRSTEIIQDADTASRLARTQPAAFGIINKPGIMNALATAAESNSRFGFISFSIPEIQKMILQAGGTQDQLNAVSQLEFLAIKQQLDAAAKAKGSVSNYERGLFGKVTAQPSDNPNVIIWKSNLLKASALFEKDVWNSYRQWEKSNRGGLEDFKETEQFKKLEGMLKNRVNAINSAFIR